MPTGLKRDLGLPATTAIAVGAMVGSGIFILPGVAYMTLGTEGVGHPSVVMAFLVSGILVLPAALSASEMATAMPEDGGSYVYVERGMGPLLGTIAGIGNWFMLSFKGALALIGGMPYVVYVLPAINEIEILGFDPVILLALFLGLVFILINAVSTSSTGTLQFVIVGIMIVTMAWFVADGYTSVNPELVAGSFSMGESGFLAATALVFISYAGVIKVAAVAEEVKDPGRVIPRAMVGSLVVTTAMYVAIVYVAVGVVDVGELTAPVDAAATDAELFADGMLNHEGEGPIMAIAADRVLGSVGVFAVTVAALMALASTANAGLLSGSRFPFAMARDDLAPKAFGRISARFNTPVIAVGITGGMMLFMIAVLPISEVAKFGSAFQIIVFVLVNLAVVGFREGAVEGYDPDFVAPLYPWLQIFGMASGLVVLTQVGTLPLVGAIAITGVSAVYYYVYVRDRIDREGAARAGVRESTVDRAVERTREMFESEERYKALVALTRRTTAAAKRDMVRMAADISGLRRESLSVVRFVERPHRVFGEGGPVARDADPSDWFIEEDEDTVANGGVELSSFEDVQEQLLPSTEFDVEYREVEAESTKNAIVEYAGIEGYDLLFLERRREFLNTSLFGNDTAWILENAPCDVVLVEDRDFEDADEIAVVTQRGAYDPLKLLLADAIAEETGATLTLMQAVDEDPPESLLETTRDYQARLASLCTVPVDTKVLQSDDDVDALARFAGEADLLVTGAGRSGLPSVLFGSPEDELVDSVDITALMVQTSGDRKRSLLEVLLMDYVFS